MASVDVLSQWVDVTVLGEEPSVDTEFITHLRTHHRICTTEEDEPKYELVVPGPEDRTLRCLFCITVELLLPSFTPTLGASPCEKYGLDDLDEVEAAIVGFLREVWGRAPYLDTKKFFQGSPTFVQAQLEMVKTNAQESYQRVQEAKASFLSAAPSARSSPEPEKKKRKALEYGSSGEVKADALAFVRKNIYPHARISMDDVSVRRHLTTLVEESLKEAGVCGKLLDIFEKAPLSSLGMTSRVEELEGRLLLYQEQERELKEEVAKLKEERDSLREKERKLQAQCNMEVGLRKTAQDSYQSLFNDLVSVKNELLNSQRAYTELDSIADGAEEAWRIFREQVGVIAPGLDLSPLDPDKVVIDGAIVDPPVPEIISESELKTRGQRIIESPPRTKDAPSSSTVPTTSSSSPMDASLPGPGGAPSASGGGDLSTSLTKK
ncbi:uncharacterized protein DS421_18g616500 [Arachis hypogaea]|nr:uncharacterized protein DS421_18g616500 [Arachis hypogaea]